MTLEVLCLLESAVTDGTLSKDHDGAFKSAMHHRAQAMMLLLEQTENLEGVRPERVAISGWTSERGRARVSQPCGQP